MPPFREIVFSDLETVSRDLAEHLLKEIIC